MMTANLKLASPPDAPDTMIFDVGAVTYTVLIVADKPTLGGRRCRGVIDFNAQEIRLWAGMRRDQRLLLLLHHLRHA